MTANGWIQILVFLALILAVTKPLGVFMARVFSRERTFPTDRPADRQTRGKSFESSKRYSSTLPLRSDGPESQSITDRAITARQSRASALMVVHSTPDEFILLIHN